MKRLRMLTMLLLFSLSAVLLSGSVQAKPKLDGEAIAWARYLVDELDYDDDDLDIERARPVLNSGGVGLRTFRRKRSLRISSAQTNASDQPIHITDKTSKRWYVSLYADNAKKGLVPKDFTVSFDVKDGSKKVHMKPRCKFHKWNSV